MAAAEQQSPDRVVPPESIDPLGTSVTASEEKSTGSQNSKKEIPSTKDEKKVSTSGPSDATSIDLPGDTKDQLGSLDLGADRSAVYQPNIYAPQLQTIYYGGYENPSIEWDDYSQFLNPEGMEMGSHGASLMFHTGYGYSPQMPYGPYSSVTTPLSSSNRDNQMYSTQQFTLAGPYFQQPGPSSTMPYLSSPTPVSQGNLTMLIGTEQQGFDGFGSARLWSDWLKSPDGQRSLTPFSPAASPQPSGGFGSFGHSVSQFSSGMDSQQRRHCGFGSSTISYDRGYSFGGMYHQGTNFGANQGMNTRGWIAMDKGTWRGKGNTGFCSCNGPLDLLSEQNRGPRATRSKNLASGPNTSTDAKSLTSADVGSEYNKPDFVTEYKDAKFFVIKSYSEDNIHKSIKYGIWASTSNGNRKLDLAYSEAKEKEAECPVFLFFSVNASGQFCGVAEMIGPVDFEKSVDYWQQDKWSGQFPVKWHIVKDVPNSLFRHIILENNGNKPVTNSRDTQEVTLEEGLKMLTIFKKHEAAMSILDDFDFYEERQRAMQERKALQQQQQQQRQANLVIPSPAVLRIEQNSTTHLTGDTTSRMSKTFAQAVRLDEKKKEDPESGGKDSLAASSAKAGDLTVDSNRHADQLG